MKKEGFGQYFDLSQLQRQDMRQRAEFQPLQVISQGTELLQHLKGFEAFWINTRDRLLQGDTIYCVVWGRTGVGKRTAASEILFLAENDPVLLDGLKRQHLPLRKEYVAFAEAANLAKLRGEIDPNHRHGQYTDPEYRSASIVHSEYTFRRINNFEGPALVVIEPSGPTAYIDTDGKLQGTDRAFSTVHLLGTIPFLRERTRILVIQRGERLQNKIMSTRAALLEARSDKEVLEILKNAHTGVFESGRPVNLEKWGSKALMRLRSKLINSMAPVEGVRKNNIQTDKLMLDEYLTDDECTFWTKMLAKMGWTISDYTIEDNPVTQDELTLHEDLLEKYDPMQSEIKVRESALKGGILGRVISFPKRALNLLQKAA